MSYRKPATDSKLTFDSDGLYRCPGCRGDHFGSGRHMGGRDYGCHNNPKNGGSCGHQGLWISTDYPSPLEVTEKYWEDVAIGKIPFSLEGIQ